MRQVTHIISELLHCKENLALFTDHLALEKVLIQAVESAGLTCVAKVMFPFDGGGVTGSIVLAESHLNIHTWPERDFYINLDLSVCNYHCDNFNKAQRLFEEMKQVFNPLDTNYRVIEGYRDVEDDKFTEYFSKDYGFFIKPSAVLHKKNSEQQEVAIYNTERFGRILRIDNYFQTSEVDEFLYHESLVHPAMTAHPNPKSVLVIGGGDGGTLRHALLHNTVERGVMVEIDDEVVELSKKWLHKIHQGVFTDPRTELIIGDGLKYAEESKEKFDVIILDLTDPIGPAKALYTKEFYQRLKGLLRDEKGILSLHCEYPFIYPQVFGKIHATLAQVFRQIEHGFTFIPLYGAVMSFAYCSEATDFKGFSHQEIEARIAQRDLKGLQLYNADMHFGIMAQPQYIKDLLQSKHEIINQESLLEEFMALYNQQRRQTSNVG